ncbi:hypothetical protein QYF61_008112 [Mycteria americana]|uniref:ribonuclease H n=1 Tax=Mycteria americana TaxID=33587 RepID=A0AAN7SHD8_MYCAM|nr:hypothetical protein QYF61_008112 [Mycteria americana]
MRTGSWERVARGRAVDVSHTGQKRESGRGFKLCFKMFILCSELSLGTAPITFLPQQLPSLGTMKLAMSSGGAWEAAGKGFWKNSCKTHYDGLVIQKKNVWILTLQAELLALLESCLTSHHVRGPPVPHLVGEQLVPLTRHQHNRVMSSGSDTRPAPPLRGDYTPITASLIRGPGEHRESSILLNSGWLTRLRWLAAGTQDLWSALHLGLQLDQLDILGPSRQKLVLYFPQTQLRSPSEHMPAQVFQQKALPEWRPQFAFTWRGTQYTWNRLPQGWKHSPAICHGLIQMALEQGEAPKHLQYIDDIIEWGNTAAEVFEKGKKIVQILLKAGFAIKQSKVKGPAQEIQFLGTEWQDGRRQIPMDVINKITLMFPSSSKKETQAFLGVVGFWRMHIPNYSLIVSPCYQVTWKKNDFKWGPEQRQAFEQIKQEIVHAVALGPVWAGQDVKNVLYTAAGENGPTWSLWQKAPGETQGRPLGFWSWGHRGSEARYTPTEKEILAAYEGV